MRFAGMFPAVLRIFVILCHIFKLLFFCCCRKQLRSCGPYYCSLFTVRTDEGDGGTDSH